MTKKKRKKVTEARRHQIFNPTGASTRVEALKPKRASRCTTSSASSNNTRPPSLSFRYARTPAGDTVAPTCVLVGVPSLGAKGEGSRGESSTATIGRAGPCTCYTILHSLYHRRPRKPKERLVSGLGGCFFLRVWATYALTRFETTTPSRDGPSRDGQPRPGTGGSGSLSKYKLSTVARTVAYIQSVVR